MSAALGVACAGTTNAKGRPVATAPDLHQRRDSCHEPPPGTPIVLDSGVTTAAGELIVTVRSSHDSSWRGDVSLRVLGPMAGPMREYYRTASGKPMHIDDLPAGRYAVRTWGIGHYGRVDSLDVPVQGVAIMARLDPTPSHWCGFPGTVIVTPVPRDPLSRPPPR